MNFPNGPQHPTFKKLQITLSYHSKSLSEYYSLICDIILREFFLILLFFPLFYGII